MNLKKDIEKASLPPRGYESPMPGLTMRTGEEGETASNLDNGRELDWRTMNLKLISLITEILYLHLFNAEKYFAYKSKC